MPMARWGGTAWHLLGSHEPPCHPTDGIRQLSGCRREKRHAALQTDAFSQTIGLANVQPAGWRMRLVIGDNQYLRLLGGRELTAQHHGSHFARAGTCS
jgi:hypothetical protein